jgi:hypothetical protein
MGKAGRYHLNLPRFAGPAAGTGLAVRLSSGGLGIHAIHGCGVLGPNPKYRGRRSKNRRQVDRLASIRMRVPVTQCEFSRVTGEAKHCAL